MDTRDSASCFGDGVVLCDYLVDAMKNCTGCKYAEWQRTKSGNLHPSGDGECTYEVKRPVVPSGMSMIFHISSGFINRRRELRDHCPCYEAKK